MKVDFGTLNKEEFEKLCKRVLIAKNPDIKTIDGSGGDEGVDSFVGTLNEEIKIWQFKFFLKRLNASRKKQIEHSLKTAREKHDLKEWTLCFPMEFSPSEEKWFEILKNKDENKNIKIDYMNEHHLKNLIQEHKSIRDDFFREEEKEKLDRIEKGLNEIRARARLMDIAQNNAYTEQVSAFKIQIINLNIKEFVSLLKEGLPFRQGLGFKKFKEPEKDFYKTFFYIPGGKSALMLHLEDEENPFKLVMPYSYRTELWIKGVVPKNSTIPQIELTCFTANYGFKQLLLKVIKENISEQLIIKEKDFNTRIKGMVSRKDKYALAITTIKLDPNIIEKVTAESGKDDIDVEIRSNIIHSQRGGLPKTKFMEKALNLVKTIRGGEKISDILFFRAKQTGRAVTGKIVTLDVHNDGRVRIWFKKSDFKDREGMKLAIKKFIDNNSR